MVRLFLVTANVGSVYDNMEAGLSIWLNEFISVVRSRDPEFVAIHFQETGGKGTENVSETAEIFVGHLLNRMEEIKFRVAEGFVDTRAEVEDQYTALSSIYFVHESLRLPVHIWDFQDDKFHEVSPFPSSTSSALSSTVHPNVHMGEQLDQSHRKQKEKFPQHFYPNCKWSRKGFLRTRWRFGKSVVDFVNIHLFHDSCNLMAASTFPSPFAQHREKTVKYTLDRIQSDGLERCPLFMFGDFNFRINAYKVMDILRKDYSDLPESEIVLGTKRFHCPEQELRFIQNFEWLKKYDFESKQFGDQLLEQDLNFHPTYPFEEDVSKPEKFMRTRIPAWCDRVLFTPTMKDIVDKDFPVEYNLIGSKVCMGDHKPVTLSLKIRTDDRPLMTTLNSNSGIVPTFSESINPDKGKFLKLPVDLRVDSGKCEIPDLVPPIASEIYGDAKCYRSPSTDDLCDDKPTSPTEIRSSIVIVSNDGLDKPYTYSYEESQSGLGSPTAEDCKCIDVSWFRLRGNKRLGHNHNIGKGGGCSGGGGGATKACSFFRFKSLTKCKRTNGYGCSRSGSLLEPIANAACEPPCSSPPSSGVSSQRPSLVNFPKMLENSEPDTKMDNLDFFTVPNGSSKLGRDFYRKCTNCHSNNSSIVTPTLLPPPNPTVVGSGQLPVLNNSGCNGTCPNRLLMMNLTSVINGTQNNKHNGLNSSNLSLIQLNTNNDIDKNQGITEFNEKIPVSWASYANNCKDCEIMNSKNFMHQHNCNTDKIRNSKLNCCGGQQSNNGLAFNCRGRSASQGSVSIQNFKCKCLHAKEGMINKTSQGAKGGCVTCSKCVIL